ncbi:MAG: hypothetical protein IJF07_07445 [Lachnospiraceae bacterium]|nr:hypothetical protein [Lachnospiraceae bacterium]
MQITVELQNMFSYSFIGPLLFIILLLVPLMILVIRYLKTVPPTPAPANIPSGNIKNIYAIKTKHKKFLLDIEQKYLEKQISDKVAYQELSAVMRFFVYEMTGMKAQNFTLQEIQKANMPKLYELVAEYYVPEFATEHNNNIQDSLDRARKVIDQWA